MLVPFLVYILNDPHIFPIYVYLGVPQALNISFLLTNSRFLELMHLEGKSGAFLPTYLYCTKKQNLPGTDKRQCSVITVVLHLWKKIMSLEGYSSNALEIF